MLNQNALFSTTACILFLINIQIALTFAPSEYELVSSPQFSKFLFKPPIIQEEPLVTEKKTDMAESSVKILLEEDNDKPNGPLILYHEKIETNLPPHDTLSYSFEHRADTNCSVCEYEIVQLKLDTTLFCAFKTENDMGITKEYKFQNTVSSKLHGVMSHNKSSLSVQIFGQPKQSHNQTFCFCDNIKLEYLLEANNTPIDSFLTSPQSQTEPQDNLIENFLDPKDLTRLLAGDSITCDSSCLTCDGTTANDCTSCPTQTSLKILGVGVTYCSPDTYSQFGDFIDYMVLTPPDVSEKATLTVLINTMEYVKYLNVMMPSNLERLSIGKGRSILSLRYGMHMSQEMQDAFIKYPLDYIFERNSLHSSFLVNFWQQIISFAIILAAAIIFTLCEKISRKYKWKLINAGCEALRTITRWNLLLILLATSFGDIVLFASLEFRTFYISFGPPSTYGSFFVCLISIVLITGLMATIVYISRKAQAARRISFDNYILFATKWQDFNVLYSGFNPKNLFSRLFILVYMTRLALPMLIAAYLYSSPLAQAILQLLISLAIIGFILYFKPIRRKINMVQLVLYEAIVLIMNVAILVLTDIEINGNLTSSSSTAVGYIVTIGNVLINLLLLVFLLLKLIIEIKTLMSMRHLQTTEEKIRGWILLLYLPLQQGGMGFESIVEEFDQLNQSTLPADTTINSSSIHVHVPSRNKRNQSRTSPNASRSNNRSFNNSFLALLGKGKKKKEVSADKKTDKNSGRNKGPVNSQSSPKSSPKSPQHNKSNLIHITEEVNVLRGSAAACQELPFTRKSKEKEMLFGNGPNNISYNEWLSRSSPRNSPKTRKQATSVSPKNYSSHSNHVTNHSIATVRAHSPPQRNRELHRQGSPRASPKGSRNPRTGGSKVIPWKY